MSLLDEAKEESERTNNRPKCSIASLDPKLRTEIDQALAAPGVTATGLERALANRGVTAGGHTIKSTTLGRHRRRDCTCESG
jgi:hypothetical protein